MTTPKQLYTVTATVTANYKVTVDADSRHEAANLLRQSVGTAIMGGQYAPETMQIDWDVTSGMGGK